VIAQAKVLGEQLLTAIRELILEVRALRSELEKQKSTTGGP
jgi:hypothetical protein